MPVRMVRLARATSELAAAGTVSEVARRWGFRDVERFASAYTARYDEPPRDPGTAQT